MKISWYKLAKYEDEWKDEIEELAKSNPYPFKHLFPDGNRIYLPLGVTEDNNEGVDNDVKELLDGYGCTITNYREGYCTLDGRNQLKIGKYLQKLLKQELNRIRQEGEQGNIYNVERELTETQKYFEDILNTFQNSSYRRSKKEAEFYVVISQDPHDIAKMSTDRSWESCMTLGSGQYHKDVFCEVQVGSLIAYLIKKDDKDINEPLARIRIRRFENNQGKSILIPEGSVYGNPIDGFKNSVNKWVQSVQGNIAAGLYERKGGNYSDTFDKTKFVMPTDKDELMKLVRGQVDESQFVAYTIQDELEGNEYTEDEYIIHPTFRTKEDAQNYINDIANDETWRDYYGGYWEEVDEETGEYEYERFSIKEINSISKESLSELAIEEILKANKGEYPDKIIEEIKNMIFDSGGFGWGKREFIKRYPEKVSVEEVEDLGDRHVYDLLSKMPDSPEKDAHKQRIISGIKDDLMHPENNNMVNETTTYHQGAYGSLRDYIANFVLDPLEKLFKPIPADVAILLVNFTNKLLNNETIGLHSEENITPRDKISIANSIIPTFWRTNTDIPELQQMYENALPLWGSTVAKFKEIGADEYSPININTLGFPIAKLGENGRQFIPFLKEKLKNEVAILEKVKSLNLSDSIKKNTVSYFNNTIEKHLYVIDALENGTGGSKKYRWAKNKNTNWYKLAKRGEASLKQGF